MSPKGKNVALVFWDHIELSNHGKKIDGLQSSLRREATKPKYVNTFWFLDDQMTAVVNFICLKLSKLQYFYQIFNLVVCQNYGRVF